MSIHSTVIGNLGRDCEVKDVNGTACTSFNVASTSGFGDKKTTTWTKVSVWGNRGPKIAPYLTKGTKIAARGEMSLREFTGRDGVAKASLELRADDIELLGGGQRADGAATGARAVAQAAQHEEEDSLPF